MNKNLKNILTIVSLCIISVNCFSQSTKKKTMTEHENLKGKVKSVCLISGENFDKIDFDEKGRIIKCEIKYSGNISIKKDYVYDNEDKLLSYKNYNAVRPDDLISEMVYTYNEKGQLIGYGTRSSKSLRRYEYDNKGNCILEIREGGAKTKKTYNLKNQLIETLDYNDTYQKQHVWGTNADGNHFEDDRIIGPSKGPHTRYEYNKFGDVSSIISKYEHVTTTSVISYEYDGSQNWIKKTDIITIQRNNESDRTITAEQIRKIEYYE